MMNATTLASGEKLFAYFANNRGRGRDNCTLIVAPKNVERGVTAAKTIGETARQIKNELACGKHRINGFRITRTSAWRGKVNVSKYVLAELGLTKSDLQGVK